MHRNQRRGQAVIFETKTCNTFMLIKAYNLMCGLLLKKKIVLNQKCDFDAHGKQVGQILIMVMQMRKQGW